MAGDGFEEVVAADRGNATCVMHVTVAARGTLRSSAISPNDWPDVIVRTTCPRIVTSTVPLMIT